MAVDARLVPGRHLGDLNDTVRDGIPLEPVLYTYFSPRDRNLKEGSGNWR